MARAAGRPIIVDIVRPVGRCGRAIPDTAIYVFGFVSFAGLLTVMLGSDSGRTQCSIGAQVSDSVRYLRWHQERQGFNGAYAVFAKNHRSRLTKWIAVAAWAKAKHNLEIEVREPDGTPRTRRLKSSPNG